MDSLEKAALDGSLFAGPNPASPTRSGSTASSLNTDDELGSDLEDSPDQFTFEDDQQEDSGKHSSSWLGKSSRANKGKAQEQVRQPIEHDGHQTGVKGVIDDRKVHNSNASAQKQSEATARAIELQRKALVGLTVHEEAELVAKETEEKGEDSELEEWRKKRRDQLQRKKAMQQEDGSQWERQREGDFAYGGDVEKGIRRGALREISEHNFIESVEREGWAIVLIYEPGIPRCNALSASLLHLSLNLPTSLSIALYRARASTIAFSLLPASSSTTTSFVIDDEFRVKEVEDKEPKRLPDPDVLPSLLAYKDGELEKTWIRVDWDVSEDGIEGLLRRDGILPTISKLGINRQPYSEDSDGDD
ncbi:hypothetical protein LQV05_000685 [Cryptococcus neoformans]|nr:hypothetical protein J007_00730 [Cryptococcus neoformans var. grubii]OXC65075.1 hypothetical protein C358_00729 [Cryptococcus neoformans var. grubii MW-RSA852]UOH79676.1 hypothetical protein LQV05_000685 [Cryptococcus neoformans]